MKWDDIELRWPDLRQRALVHWFHLTAEDVNQMTGKREELIECVRERTSFLVSKRRRKWMLGRSFSRKPNCSPLRRADKRAEPRTSVLVCAGALFPPRVST